MKKRTILFFSACFLLFSLLVACSAGGVATPSQTAVTDPTAPTSTVQPQTTAKTSPATTVPVATTAVATTPSENSVAKRKLYELQTAEANGEPWLVEYAYNDDKLLILRSGNGDGIITQIEQYDFATFESRYLGIYAEAYQIRDDLTVTLLGRFPDLGLGFFPQIISVKEFPKDGVLDCNHTSGYELATYRCPLDKNDYYTGDMDFDPENPIARNQLADISSCYNGINVLTYALPGMVPTGAGISQLDLQTAYDAEAHAFVLTVSDFSVNLVDEIAFGYCPLITGIDYEIVGDYGVRISMQLHKAVKTYSLEVSSISMPEVLPEPQQTATCYELRFYTSGTNFGGENAYPIYEGRPLDVSVGKQLVKPDVADVTDYDPAAFTPSPMDEELAANAPRLSLELSYYHDPMRLQYQYGGQHGALVEPQGERIWFFADGKLVAGGPLGTWPTEAGEYLCYLDLLFVENGVVTAKRAALQIAVTKSADYDALFAADAPRCDPLCCDPKETAWYFTDAWTGTPTYDASRPVFSAADTPLAVIAALLREKYAEVPGTDDPRKALRDITVLEAEVIGESLLDYHGIRIFSFRAAGTPISPDAAAYLCETEHMTRGDGEDAETVLFEGTIWAKRLEEGYWLPIAGSYQSNSYSELPGYRYCGTDPSVCAYKYVYPAYAEGNNALVLSVNALILNDPDKISWVEMRDAAGIEYCHEYLTQLRMNAFVCQFVRQNGNSVVPGIGREQHFSQALRTVAVMHAATELCPEIEEDFAKLLRDLRAIDPESFAYALTQVSAERAEQILSLVG